MASKARQTATAIVEAVAASASAAATAVLASFVVARKRDYTRDANAHCGYVLAGSKGIAFCSTSLLADGQPWPDALTLTPNAPAGANVLVAVGQPTRPKSGGCRYNYGVPGVAGRVQVDATWFVGDIQPATLGVQGVTLATAGANMRGSKATSAVIAAGNVAQATAAGTPVAVPAVVASTVATAIPSVVAAATKRSGKGR